MVKVVRGVIYKEQGDRMVVRNITIMDGITRIGELTIDGDRAARVLGDRCPDLCSHYEEMVWDDFAQKHFEAWLNDHEFTVFDSDDNAALNNDLSYQYQA